MKKIILLLALIAPYIIVSAETCNQETVMQLKAQIENVSYNLEYDETESESGEKEDYFKITALNLPSDFLIMMDYDTETSYLLDSEGYNVVKGGVYNVKFRNINCGADTIEEYTMMIPYYSENNDNVWFDGTYNVEEKENFEKKTKTNDKNILLIASGVGALLVIIIISSLLIKKRRKIK